MVGYNIRGTPGQRLGTIVACLFCQNLLWSLATLGRSMICRLIEKRNLGGLAALVMLLCTGCQSSKETPLPEQSTAKTPVNLMPGDVIKLSFTGASDLNQAQKIQTDGKLSLPLIGEVTAAGKTIPDLQNELIRLYKPQLRNSDVVITIESGIGQVVVSGAVAKPAKLTFDRPTTVFQAIMEAGGINEFGSLKKVRLIRTINGRQQSQVLDLTPTLKGKNSEAFYIKDGDVIYVPTGVF
jgi:protein involved in polysaccharide export with SLBB domain